MPQNTTQLIPARLLLLIPDDQIAVFVPVRVQRLRVADRSHAGRRHFDERVVRQQQAPRDAACARRSPSPGPAAADRSRGIYSCRRSGRTARRRSSGSSLGGDVEVSRRDALHDGWTHATARAALTGPIPGGIVTGTGAPIASPNLRRSIAAVPASRRRRRRARMCMTYGAARPGAAISAM